MLPLGKKHCQRPLKLQKAHIKKSKQSRHSEGQGDGCAINPPSQPHPRDGQTRRRLATITRPNRLAPAAYKARLFRTAFQREENKKREGRRKKE